MIDIPVLILAVLASGLGFALWRRTRGDRRRISELRLLNAQLQQEVEAREHMAVKLRSAENVIHQEIVAAGAALWDLDLRGGTVDFSDRLVTMTGRTRSEVPVRARRALQMVHREDRRRVLRVVLDHLREHSEEFNAEFRLARKDGGVVWIQARAVATFDDEGRPVRLVGAATDISGRVEAEAERDRLFNLSIDMLAVSGFDGFMQQINPAWVRVLGWSRDDLMGHPILYFVHADEQEVAAAAFKSLERGDPVDGLECRVRCRDGSYRWLSWSSFPYPDRRLIFSVVRDITVQKRAEGMLLENQERLRSLSNQLSLVEDRQRRQLAEAIHDGLAQQLFGLRAQVTLLKYPEKLKNQEEVVRTIIAILDETITQARTLTFELFPPVLYEVGLAAALDWLARQFEQRTGTVCVVESAGGETRMPQDLRAMAYQSVRELLANISKYAQAQNVRITLNRTANHVTLVVEDDGIGFDPDQVEQQTPNELTGGFGLFSMRERLRSIDGRMLVESRPGKGSRVFLSFPTLDLPPEPALPE